MSDDILSAVRDVIQSGDAEAIKQFSSERVNKDSLRELSRDSGLPTLRENLGLFLEICRVVAGRTEEVKGNHELFVEIEGITGNLDTAFRKLLDDAEELEEEEDLWRCAVDLIKLTLQSLSPLLLTSFHWILQDDRIPWKRLRVEEHIEFYKLIHQQLPTVVVKITKKQTREVLGSTWNTLLHHVFIKILEVHKPTFENKELQDVLVDIGEYVSEKIVELKSQTKLVDTTFHTIFLNFTSNVCFENAEVGARLMPCFERIKAAGFVPTENVIILVNQCMRVVVEKLGVVESSSLQQHIDVFIETCTTDQTTATPDLLIKVYEKEQEVIHMNVEKLVANVGGMLVQHSFKIIQLLKMVALRQPVLLTEPLLTHMYTWLPNITLTYYTLECLSLVCKSYPQRLDIRQITTLAGVDPNYMYSVCELLSSVGTSSTTAAEKANFIIKWLLEQCMKPTLSAQRKVILAAVKAVGHEHLDELMQYKSIIQTLEQDAVVRDDARGILDLLEGRSLGDAYVKLDDQEERIDGVEEEVEVVKEKVGEVDKTVKKQGKELAAAVADLKITKQDVKDLRQSVDKVLVDVERVDKRMANATPKWCQSVANLLNPKSNSDWIALALRLNYTVEDVAAWGTLEDPCMGLLVEWYATHKNSEATRAIYIVLKDLARDDGAEIVAKALKDAGEMVPVDEPLDIKHPPAIFISYQWGVQEKAKLIKEYLTNAGFSCWMDIGQMGGGDKLYEKIDHAIRGAKAIVSLVTEKYATSANCNKEVNLCVNLQKPMFQLLMENMKWPPAGAMGPIFAEYLFVRFFLRGKEQNKSGNSWPEAKMEELLMQLRHVVEPDPDLVSKQMDDWWLEKTGNAVIGEPMPLAAPASQVFISYQWGKQTEVKELCEKLTSLGFSCWLDIMQMGGGDSLYDKIDRGIRSCKLVLCCVTEKYSLSVNCRREVSLATATEKKIIPLLLESTRYPPAGPMSVPLAELQFLDFSKQAKLVEGAPYDALIEQLNGYFNVEQKQSPPEQSPQPEKPPQSPASSKSENPDQTAQSAKSSSCLLL